MALVADETDTAPTTTINRLEHLREVWTTLDGVSPVDVYQAKSSCVRCGSLCARAFRCSYLFIGRKEPPHRGQGATPNVLASSNPVSIYMSNPVRISCGTSPASTNTARAISGTREDSTATFDVEARTPHLATPVQMGGRIDQNGA